MPMPFRLAERFRAISIPERWLLLLHEFRRFGTVGAAGFVVDTAVIYGLRSSVGLYVASLISCLAAVTLTWSLNRAWTFAGRARDGLLRQWALYLGANGVGAVLIRGHVLRACLAAADLFGVIRCWLSWQGLPPGCLPTSACPGASFSGCSHDRANRRVGAML